MIQNNNRMEMQRQKLIPTSYLQSCFFYFVLNEPLILSHFKIWIHNVYITQIAKDMKQFIKVLQMPWFFLCFRLFFTYYDVVKHCYMENNSQRK